MTTKKVVPTNEDINLDELIDKKYKLLKFIKEGPQQFSEEIARFNAEIYNMLGEPMTFRKLFSLIEEYPKIFSEFRLRTSSITGLGELYGERFSRIVRSDGHNHVTFEDIPQPSSKDITKLGITDINGNSIYDIVENDIKATLLMRNIMRDIYINVSAIHKYQQEKK